MPLLSLRVHARHLLSVCVLTAALLAPIAADAEAQTPTPERVVVVQTTYRAWNGDVRAMRIAFPSNFAQRARGGRLPQPTGEKPTPGTDDQKLHGQALPDDGAMP